MTSSPVATRENPPARALLLPLLPLAGALIARSLRWRKTAAGFWVATALGALAGLALVVLMVSPSA